MTWALCFNCGEIKIGALSPCPECQVGPTGNSDLDIAFSDHRLTKSTLEDFGSIIQQIREVCDDDEVRFWTFLHYVSENYPTILTIDLESEISAKALEVLEHADLPRIMLEKVEPRHTIYPKQGNDAQGKHDTKKWWQFWRQ